MNKLVILSALILSLVDMIQAQSIRKNYQEMTQSERDALVDAFYQLRNGADLVNDLATYHNNNFSAIHFNLPNNPESDVFLAWHRRQIFELEQAMQDINANISIPFWDWTTDNSVNSDLWDQNFLGQFDSDWNLNRNLGGGQLPTSSDVNSLQSISNWLDYSNTFERGIVHVGAHVWTGGIMSGGASPRDPVFYLHHGMVDKLWQDWVEINGITSSSDIYQMASLPRYDGTYVFDGVTLPLVNPDDIVNSKSLGVFFAEDQLVQLENYTVSNTYSSQETFYYQYTIEVADNFVVPSGKNAIVESVNEVILKSGFHAQNGSSFFVKIDNDNNITTNAKLSLTNQVTRNQKTFENITVLEDAYETILSSKDVSLTVYPNPAANHINIEIKSRFTNGKLEIVDLQGKIIISKQLKANKEELNISQLKSGMHLARVTLDGKSSLNKKLVKL